ncbi:MAG: UvrD-helicase domain-containing protein, partial [Muribaculaceae bacterium]|nr:UvrD-helicase domain-containing protein [Muribaculaceae bacterium]
MHTDNYLDQLNPSQRQAVEYCSGPQLVIAGAGSGKTRVLTYKIVHLLASGYEPWRILALTFTNKAAREMRERIQSMVGNHTAAKLWMGTFHSIFARILRAHTDRIGFKPG